LPILIDGHNLIGCMSTLSLQDPDDEEHLVRSLASYRAGTGRKITVVFDAGAGYGLQERRRYAGVEVVFASDRSSADRVISSRVGRSRNPSEWLVVTSDLRLAETVARLGARVRDAQEFAAELERQPEAATGWRDSPLSPDEVEAWLSLFEDRD
jgi:predicted RNA-binding protein with PIN domain